MRKLVRRVPILRSLLRVVRGRFNPVRPFVGSEEYWISRYEVGGHSGGGSSGRLAEFKAQVLNAFVHEHGIATVIEYGCGDGRQLRLIDYPSYTGLDVSPKAVSLCRQAFFDDSSKVFKLMSEHAGETADLTLSLDVIYHLVEDEVFTEYMERLFDSSERFVVIYSSDTDRDPDEQDPHVRHRRFTSWVAEQRPGWRLVGHLPNAYPYSEETKRGSRAEFFIYERAS